MAELDTHVDAIMSKMAASKPAEPQVVAVAAAGGAHVAASESVPMPIPESSGPATPAVTAAGAGAWSAPIIPAQVAPQASFALSDAQLRTALEQDPRLIERLLQLQGQMMQTPQTMMMGP